MAKKPRSPKQKAADRRASQRMKGQGFGGGARRASTAARGITPAGRANVKAGQKMTHLEILELITAGWGILTAAKGAKENYDFAKSEGAPWYDAVPYAVSGVGQVGTNLVRLRLPKLSAGPGQGFGGAGTDLDSNATSKVLPGLIVARYGPKAEEWVVKKVVDQRLIRRVATKRLFGRPLIRYPTKSRA